MPADLEEDIRASIAATSTKAGAEFPGAKVRFPLARLILRSLTASRSLSSFPSLAQIVKQIERYIDGLRPQERTTVRLQVEPILSLAQRNSAGLSGYAAHVFSQVLSQYLDVEAIFSTGSEEAIVLALRDQNRDTLNDVLALVLAHSRLPGRARLILALLDLVKATQLASVSEGTDLHRVLKALADLPSKAAQANKVGLKAREILISASLPSYEERRLQMEKILVSSVTTSYYGESGGGHRSAASPLSSPPLSISCSSLAWLVNGG